MDHTTENIIEHYDQHPFYLHDDLISKKIHSDTLLGKFVQKNKSLIIETLVDVGCGASAKNIPYIKKYSDWNSKLFGTELSRDSILIAKQQHPYCNFLLANSEKLPFSDDSIALKDTPSTPGLPWFSRDC